MAAAVAWDRVDRNPVLAARKPRPGPRRPVTAPSPAQVEAIRARLGTRGLRLLLPGRGGRPWDDGRYRRWRSRTFDRACAEAGLEGVTPYSLSHAFPSLLVKSGLNVVEIAAQLGHGRGVTLSTYAHLLDSLGDGRVDADAVIRRARERAVQVA